jgi:uncharacterized protein YdaL
MTSSSLPQSLVAPLAATPPTGALPAPRSGNGVLATSTATTLVLYDTTDAWGWLGQVYAQQAANLASHFGRWTAKPVASYVAGDIAKYSATIYIGSTYNEPVPGAFLDDVLAATKPVIWAYDNIWQLDTRAGGDAPFGDRFGWYPQYFDFSPIASVLYKGVALSRNASNGGGVLNTVMASSPTATATVLATAQRADGTSMPWAVRSGNLTYIGEVPFAYMSETDRVLAFDDLLFDALAPSTAAQHRALVRLEDISPMSDPAELKRDADYLYSQGVKFGFGLIPWYVDPTGYENNGTPVSMKLTAKSSVTSMIKYLQSRGGTLVEHGYTHQWSGGNNPYDGVTADDFEFFRVTMNGDYSLNYVGPLPGDSVSADGNRITASASLLRSVGLGSPTIWETPHYAGTVAAYTAAGQQFSTKWERSLYFAGYLSGSPDYTPGHVGGQFFPYVVRDVYGTKNLPEDLGNIEPTPWYSYPARLPADLLNAAAKDLVVRDGFASFFFHPSYPLTYLQQVVSGLKAMGYTFANPASLAGSTGA